MKNLLLILVFIIAHMAPSFGKIIFRKCVNVEKAPNFWYHPMKTSETKVLAFDEEQRVYITDDVFSFQRINKWDDFENLIFIPLTNLYLNSHMLYFQKSETDTRVKVVAEIEFDTPILGFVGDGYLFREGNQALFAPYPTHTQKAEKVNIWSLEEEQSWTPLDKVTILSATRIRIEFTNQSATDPLRVITIGKY